MSEQQFGAVNPLLSLPSALGSEILTEWLELEDVGRLDSSCCIKEQRVLLLDLLDSDETVFKSRCELKGQSLLKWAVVRKTRLAQLSFRSPPPALLRKQLLEQTGRHVDHIHMVPTDLIEMEGTVTFYLVATSMNRRLPG